MVTTRSMSRSNPTSKKPPKVVETNSTRRKSRTAKTVKPPECIERPNSIRRKALSVFMIKEYLPQFFAANPPYPIGPSPCEVVRFGHEKWFYMSKREKDPWIELTKKMLAKGIDILDTPASSWNL